MADLSEKKNLDDSDLVGKILEEYHRDEKLREQQQRREFSEKTLNQWRAARKLELKDKLNMEFKGKHAIISFPELEVTLAEQLYSLYEKAHLRDESVDNLLNQILSLDLKKKKKRVVLIQELNSRLKDVITPVLFDDIKLKEQYDYIVALYDAAKGSIMVEWRAACNDRKKGIEKQQKEQRHKDQIGTDNYLGKHSKVFLALKEAERQSEEQARKARKNDELAARKKQEAIRRDTENEAQTKSDRRERLEEVPSEVNMEELKKHLAAVDRLTAFTNDKINYFVDQDIFNPKKSRKHIAKIADTYSKDLTHFGARSFKERLKLSSQYFNYVSKIENCKKKIEKALKANDMNTVSEQSNLLINKLTPQLEAFAKGEEGRWRIERICEFVGKMKTVNIADRMLLGSKIGKKEYKPHILFNPLDGVPQKDIDDFFAYTQDFEENKRSPIKRAWWYLRTKLGLSNRIINLQNYLIEHSTFGSECYLDYGYKHEKFKEFAPAVDIKSAINISRIVNRDIDEKEIKDIIQKRKQYDRDKIKSDEMDR